MPDRLNVAVLGAGSWGTTLAVLLDENGHRVVLWEYYEELAEALRRDRENKRFLPGVAIAKSIAIENDLTRAEQRQPPVDLLELEDAASRIPETGRSTRIGVLLIRVGATRHVTLR